MAKSKLTEFQKRKVRAYWKSLTKIWWASGEANNCASHDLIQARMTAVHTVVGIIDPLLVKSLRYPHRKP
jgi:hypothetical protein